MLINLLFPINLLCVFVTLVLSVDLEKKQNNSALNKTTGKDFWDNKRVFISRGSVSCKPMAFQ